MFNIIPLIYGTIFYTELSMSKQSPSDYNIIPTHKGYILPLQLLLVLLYMPMRTYYFDGRRILSHGLPYMPMRTYYYEEWKILSHAVLIPNMDWYPSVLNFTEAEYAEYP